MFFRVFKLEVKGEGFIGVVRERFFVLRLEGLWEE